ILSAAKSRGAVTLALRGMEDKDVVEPEEPEEAKVETVRVLVAARDLIPGESLDESATKVVDLPRAYLPSDRFGDAEQVRERAVRVEIRAGEPILESKLRSLAPERRERTVLSESIPHWTRAVSVSTKSFPHLASQIQVGDRVDVVVTVVDQRAEPEKDGMAGLLLPSPSNGSNTAVAEKIIDNVLVIGETTSETKQAPGDGATTSSEPAGSSGELTLAVNVEDVELLEHAKASGTVSIALRHQEDHGIYQKGVTIPPSVDYGLIHRGFGLPPEPYRMRVNPGKKIPGRRIPVSPPVSPGERMPPMALDRPDRAGSVRGPVFSAGERSPRALGSEETRAVLADKK
ncbi:MAG TPA: Flp pilus assembly protein CpaB, partial [Isosphaeraceae bacterium]|nr:Flp pilus assembly protein CpaB [Isosphaeraceae bacterium]